MTTKQKLLPVDFNTRSYELTYSKLPRGYGSWAFYFSRDPEPWFAPTSTFADAKKAAKVEANRRGDFLVSVGT
jgi:hypothetical protein